MADEDGPRASGWVIFIALADMLVVLVQRSQNNANQTQYSDFKKQYDAGNVAKVVIETDQLTGEYSTPEPGKTFTKFFVPMSPGMIDYQLLKDLTESSKTTAVSVSD